MVEKGKEVLEEGFNSTIRYGGFCYHVQTEDWGPGNPYFVSRIFQKGAVKLSFKTAYTDILPKGVDSEKRVIRLALELQHQKVLDLLLSGQLL